jgi:hypothetical protein
MQNKYIKLIGIARSAFSAHGPTRRDISNKKMHSYQNPSPNHRHHHYSKIAGESVASYAHGWGSGAIFVPDGVVRHIFHHVFQNLRLRGSVRMTLANVVRARSTRTFPKTLRFFSFQNLKHFGDRGWWTRRRTCAYNVIVFETNRRGPDADARAEDGGNRDFFT